MTTNEPGTPGAPPETDLAQTLGEWVTSLAVDAVSVAEASQLFSPGAPVRAPLRAGLRHLLHIAPLSHGIESLAMLEVAIMLRVTALLASPAEELGSETVLRLRADTPLIEELFPEEREVIWGFCHGLISQERMLPSEQPRADRTALGRASVDELEEENTTSYVESPTSSGSDGRQRDDEASPLLPSESAPGDENQRFEEDVAAEVASPLEPAPQEPADELVTRIRTWAASYGAPQFGHRPYDLTRARAFVRTRVSAWSGG